MSPATSSLLSERFEIASTLAMFDDSVALPAVLKFVPSTLTVAETAVLPSSAPRSVTLTSTASVPVTPSAAIAEAPPPRALSCAEFIDEPLATADEALVHRLAMFDAESSETSERLEIASTFEMFEASVPLPVESKPVALTLTVAATAVLPSSAPRLVTLTSTESVPVMPSVAIEPAPAPRALSWAAAIDVPSATASVAFVSRLAMVADESVETSERLAIESTVAMYDARTSLRGDAKPVALTLTVASTEVLLRSEPMSSTLMSMASVPVTPLAAR